MFKLTRDMITAADERRFFRHFVRLGDDDCWPWAGPHTPFVPVFAGTGGGYGRLYIRAAGTEYAHRVAFVIWNGDIPEGLMVLHKCDNPPCCNPRHLQLGTSSDNAIDRYRKGRHPKTRRVDPDAPRISWLCRNFSIEKVSLDECVIDAFRMGQSVCAISKRLGIPRTNIQRLLVARSLRAPDLAWDEDRRLHIQERRRERDEAIAADRAMGLSFRSIMRKHGVSAGVVNRATKNEIGLTRDAAT